ncbi:uncharacterized protein LOC100203094 [Hydra vulgaris]|uniref:Uncharacterized protein LOC100203094 n=1 Tax=Hydra vulgaris TaxID=6087 RepID=A0ABM4BTK4_HYDVU
MLKLTNILGKQLRTSLPGLRTDKNRTFSVSYKLSKKYKYDLNFAKHQPSGSGGIGGRKRQNSVLVDGTLINFFDLGKEETKSYSYEKSPKQSAYAEIVKTAVESLFLSTELPEPLQSGTIEVVKVEVGPSLCSANIIWKCPQFEGNLEKKSEIEKALETNLKQIRLLLPAYSTVTQTPVVTFQYDKFTQQQEDIDKLFEIVSKTKKDFET